MKNSHSHGEASKRQARHFEEIGDLYLWVRRELPITRLYQEFWTSEMLRRGPQSVTGWSLDGLCGGADLAWEGLPGSRWIGLDLALNLLMDPPKTFSRSRVERLCGDVTRLPIQGESVDVAYIRGGLHHVPDYPVALREILRALRPAGRLVLSEPSDDVALFRWLRRAIYNLSSSFDEETEKAFLRKDLQAELERAGFRVKEYSPFGYVAYLILGQTDVLRFFQVIQKLPGGMSLARLLIRIDRLLPRVPILRHFALANLVVAEKP